MDSYTRVLNALQNKSVDRTPVFPQIGDHAGIIFGYNYRDMYKNSLKATKAHLKSIELYKYDVATIQVEPSWPIVEACGGKVNYPLDKNPWIIKHPYDSDQTLKNMEIPDFTENESSNIMIEGTKLLFERTDLPVAAFIPGPLTFSFQILPYKIMINYLLKFPDKAKFVIKKSIEIINEYLKRLQEVGAEICVICEHDLQLISPKLVRKYCLDFIPQTFNLYKYNILHACGKVGPQLTIFANHKNFKNKLNMINIGHYLNISEIFNLFDRKIGIAGNIDHIKLLPHGHPKDIEFAVHEAIKKSKGDNRFMVAPGCEITTDTPIKNVESFVKAARTYKM